MPMTRDTSMVITSAIIRLPCDTVTIRPESLMPRLVREVMPMMIPAQAQAATMGRTCLATSVTTAPKSFRWKAVSFFT